MHLGAEPQRYPSEKAVTAAQLLIHRLTKLPNTTRRDIGKIFVQTVMVGVVPTFALILGTRILAGCAHHARFSVPQPTLT
jgi:hypothetical protein